MLPEELIAFEKEVAGAFERKEIHGPIHLAGGNEQQLIDLFSDIKRTDYVLSTWRSHYHALLHGLPRELVMRDIIAGKSMFLHYPEYRFMTSSIVAGLCSIACGLAAGGERVWCFVGDMAASTGASAEASLYASGHNLPVTFIIENNGLSTNTPTDEVWGIKEINKDISYKYERTQPHCGSGTYVQF
jgi:pyruvate dehydrogenase E1 component alpha subunit